MNTEDLLWEFLPEGLCEYFDIEGVEKTPVLFRVTLIEKRDLKGVPAPWQGKEDHQFLARQRDAERLSVPRTEGRVVAQAPLLEV
ncbi:hypothetical protein AUK40_04845 [Candidatus Wirthbacteria bacterium CG2_30_54_11]|uniref:Uncharacterized protein n=1 Tax=Candidatus Wirthbacteria bacterium CG2_30_54_11 TaxID=1817892 RepID=A0A1J5ITU7_9BACT|nr:MAG: hypothetical protein AUK40_04845 [Candidatus Wirthbacteria bacterium CG2_30_54_11]